MVQWKQKTIGSKFPRVSTFLLMASKRSMGTLAKASGSQPKQRMRSICGYLSELSIATREKHKTVADPGWSRGAADPPFRLSDYVIID